VKRQRVVGGSLRRPIRAAFVLLAVTIAALVSMLAWAGWTAHLAGEAATRSDRIVATAQQAEKHAVEMEAGVRGYLVHSDRAFLQPYVDSARSLSAALDTLRTLTASDDVQARRTEQLRESAARYRAGVLQTLIDAPNVSSDDLMAARAALDGLRARLAVLQQAERDLRAERRAEAARTFDLAMAVSGVALILACVVIALVYRLVARRVLDPIVAVADATERVAAGQPHAPLDRSSWGELGVLTRGFDEMARAIDGQQRELEAHNVEMRELAEVQASHRRIATAVASAAEPEEIFDMVAREAAHLLRTDVGTVMRFDGDHLVVAGFHDVAGHFPLQAGDRIRVEGTASQGAKQHGHVVRRDQGLAGLPPLKTRIASPVRIAGDPWGVVGIAYREERPVPDGAEEQLERLAGLVELALTAADSRRQLLGQVDRLEELDRLKDDLLTVVSHELRTPLTSITGYLELLDEAGDPHDAARFLTVIRRNADRLQKLVDDLLTVFRLTSDTFELRHEPFDLSDLAREAAEAIAPAAARAGVDFSADIHECAIGAAGDRVRLAQALDNLLANAVKFTAPCGGEVELVVRCEDDRAVITVRDTGMGIPADEQHRLFDRFFRSTTAVAAHIKGTGLGLAITRAVVDAHGGTIGVQSAEGEGTTITVCLPLARPATAAV
jgi:two-component system phosphate regulon sensor histidine kinase PhoR